MENEEEKRKDVPAEEIPEGRDDDGSRYVWFYFKSGNLPYPYHPANTFPNSGKFDPVEPSERQIGDVAWWLKFVGIYDPHITQTNPDAKYKLDLRTASGDKSTQDLIHEFGPVQWLRHKQAVAREVSKPKGGWFSKFLAPKDKE